jgi:hypothetical protein
VLHPHSLCSLPLPSCRGKFSVDNCNISGQVSPVANSASFSAVFGAHGNAAQNGAPWSPAAPWAPAPAPQLAIMAPGSPPVPPQGLPPNGPSSTPAVSGGGGGSSPASEIGCKKNEVQRCDSKGKRHSSSSDNTHIQILSGDIVDLRALSAVYGPGLCPGMLSSPLFRNFSHKHCDCVGQAGHTAKASKCHKMPRRGYGPRHMKSWDEVMEWKKKSKKSAKSSKKKK